MLEPVSVALKFGFLIVLYLFLLWIARSALKDLRRGGEAADPLMAAAASGATGMHAASVGLSPDIDVDREPRLRVEQAMGLDSGDEFDLLATAIIGRGDDADIRIEDPFASARHARIVPQGELWVLEDLGSTNGTYLGGVKVSRPMPVRVGVPITIGKTVMELRT